MPRFSSRLPLLAALGLAVLPAHAQQTPPPLPPEAFTACESKREGEACSLDFQGLHIEGVCAQGPDARRFCLPTQSPRRESR